MEKTDSNLKSYLSKLNDIPLLSREDENALLKDIEIRQTKILQDCAKSEFFRSELLELLKAQNISEITKISRKLDDNSSKTAIKAVTNSFIKLTESLENYTGFEEVQRNLNAVALSGSLIHNVVSRVKRKFDKIGIFEKELAAFLRYFEVSSEAELKDLIAKIKDSDTARIFFARKLETTETRLMSRIFEYSELSSSVKVFQELGITETNFPEVKKLYESITQSEAEMKRFKDELISKNLRLVVSRAKRFVGRGLDFEDLVQEGNIGLIKSINKHDPSRGTKVATYATWWVDQAIRRAISNKSKTVRIPTHIEFLQTQISTAVSRLTTKLGRHPTNEEISEQVDVDVAVLDRLDTVAKHRMGIDDELVSGRSYLDVLPDTSETPFTLLAQKNLREKIRSILSTLPPRTEKIIRLRFGIGEPQEELTFKEIGEQLNITKMGALLNQSRGLERMKKKGIKIDDLT